MKKPTLEEVKEHFKDALEIRCIEDHELKIKITNIDKDGSFYYTGEQPRSFGLNNDKYAILWNGYYGYAEITKYKDYTTRYSDKEVDGMDVIDLVKYWNLNFNQGNILKYLLRDKGDDINDLKKIIDYAQRELKHLNNN